MKQDDYFLRQIDILGRILGKILTDLFGIKSKGEIIELESVSQILKNELDLDLHYILLLPNDELIGYLNQKYNFNNDNFEKLAEILYVLGVDIENKGKRTILEKTKEIFEYLNLNIDKP